MIMKPKLVFKDRSQRGQVLFFIIYRMHSSESVPGRGNHLWKPIYKSEIKSSTNTSPPFSFEFNNFSILIADMCGDDPDKEIKIEFFKS